MEWNSAVDRYFAGVDLYQAERAPRLIFTRGWVPWMADQLPEGEVLAQMARGDGVPGDAILITDVVMNTAAEAQSVAALLGEGDHQIILVTSAYHMARSTLLFERAGLDVIPFPVDFLTSATKSFSILDLLPTAGDLASTEWALREFYGYLFYWLTA